MIPHHAKKHNRPDVSKRLGSFIVNAQPGFNISGKHKFDLVVRDGAVYPKYCSMCSSARRMLGILGEGADYVQAFLQEVEGIPIDEYRRADAISLFTARLIDTYKKQQDMDNT